MSRDPVSSHSPHGETEAHMLGLRVPDSPPRGWLGHRTALGTPAPSLGPCSVIDSEISVTERQ